MTPLSRPRTAFSLVELLTVIAIIAVLVGLLLPAVQSARESSRRSSCANNLKQLALGCLQYDGSQGHFPSGGWAWQWTGDPDAGLGPQQPGGWAFQVLPFIEQQAIFEMGTDGVAPRGQSGEFSGPEGWCHRPGADARPGLRLPEPPRCGAAAQRGVLWRAKLRPDLGVGRARLRGQRRPGLSVQHLRQQQLLDRRPIHELLRPTGVIHPASQVQAAKIRDGLSVTFLLGEFNRHPQNYAVADANPFGGVGWSISLSGLQADSANVPGVYPASGYNFRPFGSAHSAACHFAFCDGSVRPISYGIQPAVRNRLCNRADGQLLDLDAL